MSTRPDARGAAPPVVALLFLGGLLALSDAGCGETAAPPPPTTAAASPALSTPVATPATPGGEPAAGSDSAGSDSAGSDSAGSDSAGSGSAGSESAGSAGSGGAMNTGLVGMAKKPISHEEFEEVMAANDGAMKKLRAAIDGKDVEAAIQALGILSEGARKAMASEPEKNAAAKAAYLALFGSLDAASQGLEGVVKLKAWKAAEPGFQAIGRTCMSCHQQFRLTPEEEEAREASAREGKEP